MGTDNSLPTGRIIASHGHHYTVEMSDGTLRQCFPRGKKGGAVVGDMASIELHGENEGVIAKLHPRRNILFRSDDLRAKHFAANVDQLLIVVATEPVFSTDLIGRALVAAHQAQIDTLVILNKADLTDKLPAARTRLQLFAHLGIPIIELHALDSPDTGQRLLPELEGKTSLLLGQSGMGKSTILNALVPEANAATQTHSVALDAGRHTTTGTRLYHLPAQGGHIIDSPGFQNFGLYHLSPEEIRQGFPEFEQQNRPCRFYNCTHLHEPGCEVLAALERGEITHDRHNLYKRLLTENEQTRY